jgi:hypothetical protein
MTIEKIKISCSLKKYDTFLPVVAVSFLQRFYMFLLKCRVDENSDDNGSEVVYFILCSKRRCIENINFPLP